MVIDISIVGGAVVNNESKKNTLNKSSLRNEADSGEKHLKTLSQAARGLSHELNNSLTAIVGNIDLLLLKKPDMDSEIKKKLQIIMNEATRIEKSLEVFLDLERSFRLK